MYSDYADSGGGLVIGVALVGILLLLVMVMALALMAAPGEGLSLPGEGVNVPPVPQAPSAHAVEAHSEAGQIVERLRAGNFGTCVTYQNLRDGSVLRLFDWSPLLQAGCIDTASGLNKTCYLAASLYWAAKIATGGWIMVSTSQGSCP